MAEAKRMPLSVQDASRAIVQGVRGELVRFAAAIAFLNAMLPIAIYAYARITDQPFWRFFAVDNAPSEWFSSVQCLLVASVAWANYAVHAELRRGGVKDRARHAWVWLVFAVGFVVLGLDERFDLHEALRDQLLRPTGTFTELPYIMPGDVGLYLFFAVGVAFAVPLRRELQRWRPSLALFCAALALALPVVIVDSLSDEAMREWPAWRFWDYPFEEVGELWSQLLFLLAFLVVLHGRLGQLAASASRSEPG